MRSVNIKKDWNKLNTGVRIKYKSKGLIYPDSVYKGVIIDRYENFLLVSGSPDVNEQVMNKSIPYRFCIPKNLSDNDMLFIEEGDLHNARKKSIKRRC